MIPPFYSAIFRGRFVVSSPSRERVSHILRLTARKVVLILFPLIVDQNLLALFDVAERDDFDLGLGVDLASDGVRFRRVIVETAEAERDACVLLVLSPHEHVMVHNGRRQLCLVDLRQKNDRADLDDLSLSDSLVREYAAAHLSGVPYGQPWFASCRHCRMIPPEKEEGNHGTHGKTRKKDERKSLHPLPSFFRVLSCVPWFPLPLLFMHSRRIESCFFFLQFARAGDGFAVAGEHHSLVLLLRLRELDREQDLVVRLAHRAADFVFATVQIGYEGTGHVAVGVHLQPQGAGATAVVEEFECAGEILRLEFATELQLLARLSFLWRESGLSRSYGSFR